ncbi:hypothetical protein B0H14DRAFT_2573375 [Mycena olivaceomarginata]|nr:hypothetical protein B0H14DRAFT_2573375 [Mycena olivaceomarginata]
MADQARSTPLLLGVLHGFVGRTGTGSLFSPRLTPLSERYLHAFFAGRALLPLPSLSGYDAENYRQVLRDIEEVHVAVDGLKVQGNKGALVRGHSEQLLKDSGVHVHVECHARINRHSSKFDGHSSRVDRHRARVDGHRGMVDGHRGRVDGAVVRSTGVVVGSTGVTLGSTGVAAGSTGMVVGMVVGLTGPVLGLTDVAVAMRGKVPLPAAYTVPVNMAREVGDTDSAWRVLCFAMSASCSAFIIFTQQIDTSFSPIGTRCTVSRFRRLPYSNSLSEGKPMSWTL